MYTAVKLRLRVVVAGRAIDFGWFYGMRKLLCGLQIGVATDTTDSRSAMDGVFNELFLHKHATAALVLQARVFVAHQTLFVAIVRSRQSPQRWNYKEKQRSKSFH
jgi:hypothetical protein